MNSVPLERDPVELLAEEFVERYRRGERPPVSEYVQKRPDLAEQIRELFPALVVMEELGSVPKFGAPPTAATNAMPAQLGEYRILREVGRGGMGVVYEAVQESLGRHVALKVLPYPGLVSPMHLERFQREARAAARLHHSNIVPVFGVGVDAGLHYYAMQFISGQGLDAILREVQRLRLGRSLALPRDDLALSPDGLSLPQEETVQANGATTSTDRSHSELINQSEVPYFRGVARIGLQVAQALAYAHQQGVVHRDIKPSNLLLDTQECVWVTDFGLAKMEGSDQLTNTGDLVGTLRYMAPERLHGHTDPRSDVYGLGITLYEMLTLRPAFAQSNRTRLMEQIAHTEPQRPRQIDPHIPRDLETIVLTAIAKEPERRYDTAQAMAEDLQRYVGDQPIRARRARIWERGWRWCRRNPRLAALTATVLLLVSIIAIGSPILMVQLWRQRDEAQHNLTDAERAKQEKTEQLYLALRAEADAQRLSKLAGRRFKGLDALTKAHDLLPQLPFAQRDPLKLRNEFIASLSLPDLGIAKEWEGYPTGSAGVVFDAALERYARSDEQGNISIRKVADDVELVRLPGPGAGAWTLRFSPNGRYLVAGYQEKIRDVPKHMKVWDCEARRVLLEKPNSPCSGELDFSPDSTRVALATSDNTVDLFELPTGRRVTTIKRKTFTEYVAFHPQGRRLAISVNQDYVPSFAVEICDLDTGKTIQTLPLKRRIRNLAWSRDGKRLAVANGSIISLWEKQSEERYQLLEPPLSGHQGQVTELAFSHSGALLASKGHDGTLRMWDIITRRELARADSFYLGCSALAFSADDAQLAFACDGARMRLWRVADGRECRLLRVSGFNDWQTPEGCFSPDGKWVASAGAGGVCVWECATGQQVAFVRANQCWSVAFTPDSSQLITSGMTGLEIRPFFPQKAAADELIGSKTLLHEGNLKRGCASRDGRVIATTGPLVKRMQALVFRRDDAKPPVAITDHDALHYVALSPDGQWLATGTWYGSDVKVWHTASGKLERAFKIDGSAALVFSPDGRALVISTGKDYRFIDTATWTPQQIITQQSEIEPGDISFTDDARLIAIRYSPTRLRLLRPDTGAPYAELQMPDPSLILRWHRLSPDGRYLVAASTNGQIHLWDLRLIREHLAARGLDWEAR